MFSKILPFVAASVGLAQAASPLDQLEFGFCPKKPKGVGNFDAEQYQGTWYEIYRDKYLWYETDVKCVSASYKFDRSEPLYPIGVNN